VVTGEVTGSALRDTAALECTWIRLISRVAVSSPLTFLNVQWPLKTGFVRWTGKPGQASVFVSLSLVRPSRSVGVTYVADAACEVMRYDGGYLDDETYLERSQFELRMLPMSSAE